MTSIDIDPHAGKTIAEIALSDNRLVVRFADETQLILRDDGQSCCETRYMRTDDDLAGFVGAELRAAEVRDAPNVDDEYGVHEVRFLVLHTTNGDLVASTHNEHNGYYGGFNIVAESA